MRDMRENLDRFFSTWKDGQKHLVDCQVVHGPFGVSEFSAVEPNHWHGVCGTRRHLKTFQPGPGTKSTDPFQMHP
ncbi:hypothetical protein AOLI_G00119110 [Acnodon oligacanthus]